MVVVKFPCSERAVGSEATLHLDDAGGTKIGPGEFFFARPNDFHGMTSRAGQASGFQRGVAGVLSAIRGTGVRHNHANAAFGNMEYSSEVVADSKGPLRSRPNRQFPAGPFGNSSTRFERGVRDISNGVGRVQTMRGAREAVVHGTFLIAMASFGTARGLFLEIREEFFVRNLRYFFPLRANGSNGVLCFALGGRGCANEIAIADDRYASHRFCGAVIARKERCAERGRAQDFAIEHPSRAQVRCVLVTAGNEGAAIDLWNRFAGNLPLRRRCDGIFRRQILCQRLAARELAYRSDRPEAGSLIFASAAISPSGATFHSFAATPISKSRAAAATRRNCGVIVGVVRLPKVPGSNGVSAVSAVTIRTLSKGTRNSSAIVCARDVRIFWPISTFPVNPVTVPPSPTCSQEVISLGGSSLWKDRGPGAVSCIAEEFLAMAKTAMPAPRSLKKSRRANSK